MEVLGRDGLAVDRALAAEVDLDRPRAPLFAPLWVDVLPPLALVGSLGELLVEGEEELNEVGGRGRQGAVAVRERDREDEEVGRCEGEEDGEDVVDARVRVDDAGDGR